MVLQIVYVFHQLTAHAATRDIIIRDTRELMVMSGELMSGDDRGGG